MQHITRQHAELGGSTAKRWMSCPGSIRLSRGIATRESAYADEGTTMQELAQVCLQQGHDASTFIGQQVGKFIVSSGMAKATQIYIDHCRRLIDHADEWLIETPIDLESYGAPVPMFGIADFISYFAKRQELHIVDLKGGKGVFIPATRNPQLAYYALGAVARIDKPVARVITTIAQPRFTAADPIRSNVIDALELAEFAIELMAAARATMAPDAPTRPGDHCRFCPAQSSCLSYQNERIGKAYHQFLLADQEKAAHAAGA
jgi:hypothetical protein